MKRVTSILVWLCCHSASPLLACSVCFGKSSSSQIKALWGGVIVLLGVTILMLGAIAYYGFKWAKRAREIEGSLGH